MTNDEFWLIQIVMPFLPHWMEASPPSGMLSKEEKRTIVLSLDQPTFRCDREWNNVSQFDLVILTRNEFSLASGDKCTKVSHSIELMPHIVKDFVRFVLFL